MSEVELKTQKLETLAFEIAIIERCQGQELSGEEALIVYLVGVSVGRVTDISLVL